MSDVKHFRYQIETIQMNKCRNAFRDRNQIHANFHMNDDKQLTQKKHRETHSSDGDGDGDASTMTFECQKIVQCLYSLT